MKVNFYAAFREIAGAKSVEFPLPAETTAQGLIDALVARYPEMRSGLLDAEGRLMGHVHVFINGRDLPFLPQGPATRLQPTDIADVFPATGGG